MDKKKVNKVDLLFRVRVWLFFLMYMIATLTYSLEQEGIWNFFLIKSYILRMLGCN